MILSNPIAGTETSILEINGNALAAFDHMDGFNQNLENWLLEKISNSGPCRVYTQYFLNDKIKQKYPNLDLRYCLPLTLNTYSTLDIIKASQPTDKTFDHFIQTLFGGALNIINHLSFIAVSSNPMRDFVRTNITLVPITTRFVINSTI